MKKDATIQTADVINLSDMQAEAFAVSTWYVNDTAEYQAAEYAEDTAVHTAAVLREIRISVHGDLFGLCGPVSLVFYRPHLCAWPFPGEPGVLAGGAAAAP